MTDTANVTITDFSSPLTDNRLNIQRPESEFLLIFPILAFLKER
jgi:hypothetical protein